MEITIRWLLSSIAVGPMDPCFHSWSITKVPYSWSLIAPLSDRYYIQLHVTKYLIESTYLGNNDLKPHKSVIE